MNNKKIIVIDNYDSFAYNLVNYIEKITGHRPDVFRNDEITLEAVGDYEKILLSPGPGIPSEAGIILNIIKRYSSTHSIFGVCLGHQAIGEAFGGKLINLDSVYHGVASKIKVLTDNDALYQGIPKEFMGGRYHSWVVANEELPDCLLVTAIDESGLIMGLSHKQFNVRGVQFHPESVLTENGMKMMENWLNI
jgi:anthranilate synthase component 2